MNPGIHELITVVMVVLGGVSSLVITIITWIGKGALAKQETNTTAIADNARRVAVLEASALPARVTEHDVRIGSVERCISELTGDIRVIRAIVERLDSKKKGSSL